MKTSFYLLFFVVSIVTNAVTQNALDFDGIDDKASAPNASALIANGDLSLSFWVYPTDPAPAWPLFDGMAGFRNDVDADFYILHLNTTSVECRFRNSLGTSFDLVYSGVDINTWNHFALTYDGATLTLFHNGEHAAAIAASGTIVTATRPLNMGFLPYSFNTFALDGSLDDVCLWNKALSAAEVGELFSSCTVALNDPALMLCYEFNQGVAGGDNTAITAAVDSKGNIDAPLTGMTLNGDSSNFVEYSHAQYQFQTVNTCEDSYTSPSGNYTWTSSGAYTDTIFNPGCTEVYFINLSFHSVDTSVTQTGPGSLSSNETGATYQWIDCETGEAVAGATAKTFEASESGYYAVVVTKSGCTDTSSCFNLVIDATSDVLKKVVGIYPNPFQNRLFINLGPEIQSARLEIMNLNRQVLWFEETSGGVEVRPELPALPQGIYFLLVKADNATGVWKLIKLE